MMTPVDPPSLLEVVVYRHNNNDNFAMDIQAVVAKLQTFDTCNKQQHRQQREDFPLGYRPGESLSANKHEDSIRTYKNNGS